MINLSLGLAVADAASSVVKTLSFGLGGVMYQTSNALPSLLACSIFALTGAALFMRHSSNVSERGLLEV